MFNVKPIKKTAKFMLSSSGVEAEKVDADTKRYNAVLSNPCYRVIEKTIEKETEKTMNDKGIVVSIIERLYTILTWVEDTL